MTRSLAEAWAIGRPIDTPHGKGYEMHVRDKTGQYHTGHVVVRLTQSNWATYVGDQRIATGINRGQACQRHAEAL